MANNRVCFAHTNDGMVDYLISAGYVSNEKVIGAMRRVDRRHYLREDLICRRRPSLDEDLYYDSPQRIGHDVTISAPHMHAMTLELLAPMLHAGNVALDVGSGTGYLTACLAEIAGENGQVVGIERVQELVPWAGENLRRDGKADLLDSGRVVLRDGDGSQGARDLGPFSVIHVGAAAPRLPAALVAQLACPGRLVVPVGPQGQAQDLRIVDKDQNGQVTSRSAGQCMFVPLHMPSVDDTTECNSKAPAKAPETQEVAVA